MTASHTPFAFEGESGPCAMMSTSGDGYRDAPHVLRRIPPSALLDLNRLATLREVARCGSYSAAADSLCFTPSAVSLQMTGLARDLQVQLFDRTPRGMRPTAAAEILVTHIEAVFSRLNQAQGELEAVAGGVRGRLRVGSFPTATVGFLAETIGTFQERFSSVDLTLADGEPHESIVRLKERELDLAVVFDFDHRALSADFDGRVICRDSEIECADLFDDPFLVVLPRDNPLGVVVLAALLAAGIACAVWWAYFDVVAVVAEQRFRAAVGGDQLRMARDSYALLHLPMVSGIVLFALGVKKILEHTGDPLTDMPAVALCGGLALYLLAHVGFRLRNVGSVSWTRIVAAAACLALIPVATRIAGVATLAILLAVWTALVGYEVVRYAEARARVRAERIGH